MIFHLKGVFFFAILKNIQLDFVLLLQNKIYSFRFTFCHFMKCKMFALPLSWAEKIFLTLVLTNVTLQLLFMYSFSVTIKKYKNF